MQGATLKEYLRNLKISEGNQKLINNEFDIAIENRKLMQGLSPIPIEERPSQLDNREEILMILKEVTYEPRKFFSMLYDKGEIGSLVEYLPQFMRTVSKYRSNLSAMQLYKYWEDFKDTAFNTNLKVAGVDYNYNINPIAAHQAYERTNIRTDRNISFKKLQELERLEKEIKELAKKQVRANVFGTTDEWTKINDSLLSLTKKRDALVNKIELETAKQPFNPLEEMERGLENKVNLVQNSMRSMESSKIVSQKRLQGSMKNALSKEGEKLSNEIDSLKKQGFHHNSKEIQLRRQRINEIKQLLG